jgi:CHASE2 domain-containing sensor protein
MSSASEKPASPALEHEARPSSPSRQPAPAQPEHKKRRPLAWLDLSAIILVVIVGILSYKYEDFKEQFPGLITAQLWAYQKVTLLLPPKPQPKYVVPVEIDDQTFYTFLGNESRNDVTDRKYLAELINTIAAATPAVIALDINFDATLPDSRGDRLNHDDQALMDAFLSAQRAGIPVVLTYGFREGMAPVPQVFDGRPVLADDGASSDTKGISFLFPEEESKARAFWVPRYGFDHPADDYRKVPLAVIGTDANGKDAYDYYSFALQIADAYARWAEKHPAALAPAAPDPGWREEMKEYEFVYTTFIPPDHFPQLDLAKPGESGRRTLRALDVSCAVPAGKTWDSNVCPPADSARAQAVRGLLANKIVLIGGNRHGYKGEEGDKDYIDNHPSPVGEIRGMYLQANYVEGLLDNRVMKQTPRGIAAALDVAFALIMLKIASKERGFAAQTARMVLVFLGVLVVTVVAALALKYVLDFIFPLVLMFLHPALESYIHLVPGFHHAEGNHG